MSHVELWLVSINSYQINKRERRMLVLNVLHVIPNFIINIHLYTKVFSQDSECIQPTMLTVLGLLYDKAGQFLRRAKIVFIISNLMVTILRGMFLHYASQRWDLQLTW